MRPEPIGLLLLLLVWHPTLAGCDIDVTVPPGLPPEWVRLLPNPVLTDLGQVPRRRQSGTERGSVTPVTSKRRTAYLGSIDSSFGFSGVLTIDMPLHFRWTISKIERPAKFRELTGPGASSEGWRYPPPFPLHLYWLSIATMLRQAIHPALVTRVATIEHLVLLGEPAYLAAVNSRTESALREISKAVVKHVGPLPQKIPRSQGGLNPYQKLIHKLTLTELATGYPYSPDRRFARRVLSLDREGLTPVIALTAHKHAFVRRNAVALLGKYDSQLASAKLRELLDSTDRVVRNRAIQAVVDRQDKVAIPWLIRSLRSRDRGLQVLAATALGHLRAEDAHRALVAFAMNNQADPDVLWATLPAIGRIGKPARKALAMVRQLEQKFSGNRFRFGESNPIYAPPVRDRVTMADVLAEMCRIARSGMRDQGAQKALLAQIRQGQGKRSPPGRAKKTDVRGNIIRRRGNVLKGISSPNLFFVCDILRRMGTAGNKLLLEVVNDTSEESDVRAYALEHLRFPTLLTFLESLEQLAGIARTSDVGLLRARALALLELHDKETAIEIAKRILIEYSVGQADYTTMRREWVVIPAMRLLGRCSANQPVILQRVIARAQAEQEDGHRRREKNNAKLAGKRNGQVPLITIPPIVEVALLEIGRTGSLKAAPLLVSRATGGGRFGRAEAVLALGAIGGKRVIRHLIERLGDQDAWVRFCAYRSLRQITDADFFCDWIFGSGTSSIQATVKQWRAWYRKKHP